MRAINKVKTVLLLVTFTLVSVLGTGCTEEQNMATVGLSYGGYSTAKFNFFDLFLPKAHANVSSLTFCFKRLRFKRNIEDELDAETSEDNVDFDLGEVTIDASGTYLGEVVIPEGEYKRIEFDLEDTCPSGNSISLTNDNGTFTSQDRITIKFEGLFTASDSGTLTLAVQDILNAMNLYDGSGDSLKDTAEAIVGEM